MNTYNKLLEYQKNITDLEYTIYLLRWELKTSAPVDSLDELIHLITNYENKLFELKTNNDYGKLINDTIACVEFNELEEAEQRYIHNLLREFNELIKVPQDFYLEYTELKAKSNMIWRKAKSENNYELFKPYLNKVIEMTKKYYRYLDNETKNLYDVMLNRYETGMTSEVIDKLFSELKESLIPLISKKREIVKTFNYDYSKSELIECANYLLNYIGFDLNRGKVDIGTSGFMEKLSKDDVRIAFKYTTDPADFVTTVIHEGGHGLFEQNIKPLLSSYQNGTIEYLYALHESQSRFYENILGRNINFWIPIYDDIKKILHLDMSVSEFASILNSVKPTLIRTEADELTYCMHIILRYEIERDIFNGKINLNDLSQVWNDLSKKYLDLEVDKDQNGVLQDIHWGEGDFGYFPSYLIGNIYDGMFKEAIEENLGNIDEILKSGRIKEITKYLSDKIYTSGGAYNSLEVIDKVCEKTLSVKPIINYYNNKYR